MKDILVTEDIAGQGNIVGNPIVPVIKLSANPLTCETMSEHIDLNVSPILRGKMTLDEAGDQLIEMVRRTCNGRFTATQAMATGNSYTRNYTSALSNCGLTIRKSCIS